MKIKTKLRPENEMLSLYLAVLVSLVFFALWVFTDIKPTKLFFNYIVFYCVVVLIGFFYPFKK
jgi:uncharacterized membrane protein YczE